MACPERFELPDLLIRSQTLYPAELWAHNIKLNGAETGIEPVRCLTPQDFKSCASASSATPAYKHFGSGNRIRTCDPHLGKVMFYH